MKRIDFIKRTAVIATFGLPLLSVINSCASESAPTPNPPASGAKDCLANGTSSSISSNHGHRLDVTKEDVSNGSEKTYSIQDGASHDHNVTITAANFTDLKNTNSIQVDSTTGDGHTHSVTVSCA